MPDRHEGRLRLTELDALRGLAVLMVVTFHLSMPFNTNPATVNVFRFGLLGVDLFFIISGFVITMSINNVKNGKEFIVNRFARLYPTYWVCLTLSFLLRVVCLHYRNHVPVPHDLYVQFAVNFSMIQYFFNIPDIESPYWTLIIELLFYAVMFLIYKSRLLHKTEYILLCVVFFQLAVEIADKIHPGSYKISAIIAFEKSFQFLPFLSLFLIGIVFYNMWTQRATVARYIIIILCYLQQVLEHPYRPALDNFNIRQWHYAVVLAVFIFVFILFIKQLLGFIASAFTLFLGRLSYALYLFHQIFLLDFVVPFFRDQLHFSYYISGIFAILVAVAVAAIITIFIDEPIRLKIRKTLKTSVKKA